ncbi:MAG: hypothetical protein WBA05_07275 [Gordonia sp. (in: high G+C Gram-positive bacteria)]|uniref:hypothetical protein n=1 Tax=Gordonia sp. (in: high G+C Gram-positive bacteria) TaxID=84139 RepID=UPI003C70E3C4
MWNVDVNGLVRRADALERGLTDADIKQALRCGELISACRGLYAPTSSLPEEGWRRAQELYRRRCLAAGRRDDAAAGRSDGGAAPLSHQSAAALHGLEMLKPDLTRVHVGVARDSSGKCRATRHIHPGLDERDVVELAGIAVARIECAAVEVAVTSDFAGALAVFDSALRMGVPRASLEEALNSRQRRGSVRARQALRLAEAGAANPGESWSRAQMIQAGLPIPLLQQAVDVEGHRYYSDFEWARRLIGEFDGEGKYLSHRRLGESVADAVLREKERENRLRDMGFDVVRWDWSVLERRGVVARVGPRLEAAGLV